MNFVEQNIVLILNAINFIFIMYNFFLFRKVEAALKNKVEDNPIQLKKDSGDDIQTNLGRRLLEIQRGRYARPYGRFNKKSEDE